MTLYSIRSETLSQWRDFRIGVTCWNFGAWTTTGFRQCRDLIGEWECSSYMKPRLRADWVVSIEVENIFPSCSLSPIIRNSVLEELSDKSLEVIHEFIDLRESILEVRCLPERLRDERREKVVCHRHRGGDVMIEMKWEYWEELYTSWWAKDHEQSLEERHTVRCARKRSSRYILHRRCEMRGMT